MFDSRKNRKERRERKCNRNTLSELYLRGRDRKMPYVSLTKDSDITMFEVEMQRK